MAERSPSLESLIALHLTSSPNSSAKDILAALSKKVPSIQKQHVNSTLYRSKRFIHDSSPQPLWSLVEEVVKEPPNSVKTYFFIDADNVSNICKEFDGLIKDKKLPPSVQVRPFCASGYNGALKEISTRTTLNEKDATDAELIIAATETVFRYPGVTIVIASKDMLLISAAKVLKLRGYAAESIQAPDEIYKYL